MRISAMYVYPVKGLRGRAVTGATVQRCGLAGDRRYMLVDPDGRLVTQRELPVLTQATADYDADGTLRVHPAPSTGLPELAVGTPHDGRLIDVQVWRSRLPAMLASAEAHAWFGKLTGADVRLVYLDDPTRRPVNPKVGLPTDRVSFADGYPLLVANQASADRLNEWLLAEGEVPEALPMDRFRPSLVVEGAPPWAEDAWRRLRVGAGGAAERLRGADAGGAGATGPDAGAADAREAGAGAGVQEFRVAKPCDRCVVTTIDQDTGRRGAGPLRMLARRHRIGDALAFGMYLIPDTTGPIRVGDPVHPSA